MSLNGGGNSSGIPWSILKKLAAKFDKDRESGKPGILTVDAVNYNEAIGVSYRRKEGENIVEVKQEELLDGED